MLVLSRRNGERVVLELTEQLPAGTRFEIEMLERKGRDGARIGFVAASSIRVLRKELVERTTEHAR